MCVIAEKKLQLNSASLRCCNFYHWWYFNWGGGPGPLGPPWLRLWWRVVGNSCVRFEPMTFGPELNTLPHRLFGLWKNCISDIIRGSPLKTYSKVRGVVQCEYFAGKKREGSLHCGHPYSLITKHDNSVAFIARKFRFRCFSTHF